MLLTRWTFIFTCFLWSSCSSPTILGEWKREANPLEKGDPIFINSGWGDITFNRDSTFSIMGDTTAAIEDSVSGWHAGGSVNGRWKIEEGFLLLHTDYLPAAWALRYQILQLTSKNLVILSTFDKNDTTKSIKYTRKQ